MYSTPKDVRGLRVAAAFIDSFLFGTAMSIVFVVQLFFQMGTFNEDSNQSEMFNPIIAIIFYVVNALIAFGYFTLFPLIFKGKTLGKLMLGIKVLSFNYEKATIWRLLFRNVYFFYYAFVCGLFLLVLGEAALFFSMFGSTYILGFVHFVNLLFVLISKDAKGFHDFIAGTVVVHKNFDLNALNEVNEIERRQMEWAVFEDDGVKAVEKHDVIEILKTEQDEIELLKSDKDNH